MNNIGFIGLGRMGTPMVSNLIASGYNLRVYDVNKESVKAAESLGAIVEDEIAELARHSDCVITMVQTGEQIKSICLGDAGVFASLSKNAMYIDCSSIEIAVTKEMHEHAAQMGIAMLDAPVSGGVAGASAASLTIMVGGSAQDYDRAEELLQKLGKNVIHAGEAGNGQAAKICNNLLLGISMIGVSEAFNLAKGLGLDVQKFYEISSRSSGQCWSMTSYCPEPGILPNVPSANGYQPGFPATMMLKDLNLGHVAAEAASIYTPLGEAARTLYQGYVEQDGGQLDFSSIIRFLASRNRSD